MKRTQAAALMAALLALACPQAEAPPFEIVRVPESAYLEPDAAAPPEAAAPDAAQRSPRPPVKAALPSSCFELEAGAPRSADEDEDYPECERRRGRISFFEPTLTHQIRTMLDRNVCCYR